MRILTVFAVSGILFLPTIQARAGSGDFIAGVAVGAVGKTLFDHIVNSNNKSQNTKNRNNTPNTTTRVRTPTRPTQAELERRAAAERQREENRQIQTWLNALGFNVGAVDGRIGGRTRTGIGNFQVSIDHPRTGQLTRQEISMLDNNVNGTPMFEQAEPEIAAFAPPQDGFGSQSDSPVIFPEEDSLLPAPADRDALSPQNGLSAQSLTPGNDQQVSAIIFQIAILGLSPLADASHVEDTVSSNNYDRCDRTDAAVHCVKETSFMKDTLLVGFVRNNGSAQIHTIRREMEFRNPVSRINVLQRFSEQYPQLITATEQTLASTPECTDHARPLKNNGFIELEAWSETADLGIGPVSEMASKCSYHYSVSVAETEMVNKISITLFAGAPIVAALTEGGVLSGGSELSAQITF